MLIFSFHPRLINTLSEYYLLHVTFFKYSHCCDYIICQFNLMLNLLTIMNHHISIKLLKKNSNLPIKLKKL